ncbi:MAG: cobalamin B12-binding domain-containing protein [Deltaproteobacteria bacterium]|nr:cobalamin B12-binding domain-containing protein [Deltaproteobacteria bacterium]MBI3386620.1 cobalamin B12-binding domain-containing protein [Deltaproteobacteria bacterium]
MASPSLRVLLISANTEKLPDPVFPIGAAYMAAVAEQHGHAVDTLDLCFLDAPRPALDEKIRACDPQVVGISLRNLDSSSYPQNTSYIDDYQRLIAAVRELTGAPIVLGGAGFTITPQTILEYLGADVGVVGEGEMAFPWILQQLAGGQPLASTPEFICEPVNGGVCVSSVARIKQLDVTGIPMRQRFDMQRYYERGGALNIQTKRGCYFECVFCSYPLIEGSKVRMRTATTVVDEMQAMRAEFGIRHWFFVDNIFNMPIRHAKDVCAEIIARELDVEWSAYLNPKFMDAELCDLMARSGCKAIEFGTDSGAPAMIENLKKEFSVDDLRHASALCHQYRLKFCHSLIFGGPGETSQTVTQTLDLMDELKPTAVIAFTGIRVLPGTGMVDIALRDGQIDPDDNLLYPKFYISPNLRDELIDRIEAYAHTHTNWIVPGKGIKTNIQVLQKLRERKIKGQLWRLLR